MESTRVSLTFDELRADWTTERGPFNDRDEVYCVVAGVSGSPRARRKISVPRVSPPPPEDYFQFKTGERKSNIGLTDMTLESGDVALVEVVIREQDNAQKDAILAGVEAAAVGAVALYTGSSTLTKIAEDKAKAALKQAYDSLGRDGDQNIGAFSVQITNLNGRIETEWYDGPGTLITSRNGSSATFEAEASDAKYTGRMSARVNGWSEWQSLGGIIIGPPAAICRQPTIIDTFARGKDNHLWQNSWTQSSGWLGWNGHNDGFELGSSPAVDSMGPNHKHLFVRGTDGAVWQKWYLDGQSWSIWSSHGGNIIGEPAVHSRNSQITDIFARGMDDRLWTRHYQVDHWENWARVDDFEITSSPAVCSTGPEDVHVFVRGKDKGLYHKFWAPSGWSGWEPLGGVIIDAPCACSRNGSIIDVFARGTDDHLWQRHWHVDHWESWWGHGGLKMDSSPAAASLHSEHVQVFTRGKDGQLWWKSWLG